MSATEMSIDELKRSVGTEIGISAWVDMTQDRIDQFADVTGDHQFIHVDVERAKAETPFGGTIAHGFLTMSLLAGMADEALPGISGRKMGINYGFEKMRFLSPVPSGSRVRGRFNLDALDERKPGEFQLRYGCTVEIEDSDKPALAAQWLVLAYV
ncbi:MAG: MaoC family dehydratase [Pseudomonadota bacterium]